MVVVLVPTQPFKEKGDEILLTRGEGFFLLGAIEGNEPTLRGGPVGILQETLEAHFLKSFHHLFEPLPGQEGSAFHPRHPFEDLSIRCFVEAQVFSSDVNQGFRGMQEKYGALRVTQSGGSTFLESIDVNERGSTTQEVVLPDIICGTSPKLAALQQTNYVIMEATGYSPADGYDQTITVYGGVTSVEWNGTAFSMTLNNTTTYGDGSTLTSNGTITGTVNAAGTEVIAASGTYVEDTNGTAGNTKHEVYTLSLQNVPVSGSDNYLFTTTATAALVSGSINVTGTAGSYSLSAGDFAPLKSVRITFMKL